MPKFYPVILFAFLLAIILFGWWLLVREDILEKEARNYCSNVNIAAVDVSDAYIRITSSLLGGGFTYIDVEGNEIHCPVVAPDAESAACKTLATETNWEVVCTPGDNIPGDSVVRTGNLVRGNPGLNQDTWYLISDEPGAPATTRALTTNGRCTDADSFLVCDTNAFAAGDRVDVKGEETGESIVVGTVNFGEGTDTRRMDLFYYNPAKDRDASGNILCSRSGLESVSRTMSVSDDMIGKTIQLLLRGVLAPTEVESGLTTEFPLSGVSVESSRLQSGTLTLVFTDPNSQTSGGSCRAGILWFQIDETAKQFQNVQSVRFEPEELFQP
jgi:hypothetical protein